MKKLITKYANIKVCFTDGTYSILRDFDITEMSKDDITKELKDVYEDDFLNCFYI